MQVDNVALAAWLTHPRSHTADIADALQSIVTISAARLNWHGYDRDDAEASAFLHCWSRRSSYDPTRCTSALAYFHTMAHRALLAWLDSEIRWYRNAAIAAPSVETG